MTKQELASVKKYLQAKGLPQDIAVTFPDVFIVDETSQVRKRSEISNLGVLLGGGVRLRVPVVSANMADVTEAAMAIAMARFGGCGFIHQFLPIEERAAEVGRVKRADNEVIDDPWRVDVDDSFE